MQALADFRELANVPDDFAVLFLQGGASLQFAAVPMNLLSDSDMAGYVNTGTWAQKAFGDAKKVAQVYEAWSGAEDSFNRMPTTGEIQLQEGTRYLHVTSNE
ncbi:MAG TPA: 3-phosphoserine/phosphohydroxythreonine transaminase, partial [Acidimicrobiaceae bacterium]|nr:3-phosphoserine/phosphohydroxythreonine transaminase [Acidimicrobiaceae bacterium]